MPIYEYQTFDSRKSCPKCLNPFEVFQNIDESPFSTCPACGNRVKKVISLCRSAVIEIAEDDLQVEKKIREYEHEGMWSHAAELADKHSENTKDKNLKLRALDNFKKAGYETDTLSKA
jgi:putative FmdB family regulatory protein